MDKIKAASTQDAEYTKLLGELQSSAVNLKGTVLRVDQKCLIWFKDKLYIPKIVEIKLFILNEMHKPPFASHPRYQKMIIALRKQFFWPGLKSELVDYLSKCLECQQVKTEHQHPTGLLQLLPIPEWKWEIIS